MNIIEELRESASRYDEMFTSGNPTRRAQLMREAAAEIAKLRAAIELGQENCNLAYNDLRDERNALLLAIEDHARHWRLLDHMSYRERLKAVHELVAEFLDEHGVKKPAEEPSPAPGEMP